MTNTINILFNNNNNQYNKKLLNSKLNKILHSTRRGGNSHLGDSESHKNALKYFSVYEKRQQRLLKSSIFDKYNNNNDNNYNKNSNINKQVDNHKIVKIVPYSFVYDVNADHRIDLMVLDHGHLASKSSKFSVGTNTIEPAIETLSKLFSHSTSSSVFEIIPKSGSVILQGEVSVLAAVWGHPTFILNVLDRNARKMYEMDIKKNKIGDSLKIFPTKAHSQSSSSLSNNNNNNLLADLEMALDLGKENDIDDNDNLNHVDPNEVYDPEYIAKQVDDKSDVFLLHLSLCGINFPTVSDFRAMSNAFRSLFFRGQLPFVLVSICRDSNDDKSNNNNIDDEVLIHDSIGDLFNTFSRSNYTAHTLIDLKYLNDYSLVTFVEQIFKDRVKKPTRIGNAEKTISKIGTQTLLFVHGSVRMDFEKWLNPPHFHIPAKDEQKVFSKSVFEEKHDVQKEQSNDGKMNDAAHASSSSVSSS